jgi:UDP-N-acetylmuramoylalanine--D-glutamate ligase
MRTLFYEKKITVVGLARSGVGAANLLASLGANVTVTDLKGPQQLERFIKELDPRVSLALEDHPEVLFSKPDIIIISPGVPADIKPIKAAQAHGIRIIGELELAYEVLHSGLLPDPYEMLAITGTNGKSTTTELLNKMIECGGLEPILGGNIGNSIAAEVQALLNNRSRSLATRYIVVELSSFQLEATDSFRPKGATILNITPDHLDRYHEMKPYMEAKCRIALRQGASDFIVLNADDPYTPELEGIIRAQGGSPSVFYFSRRREVEGIWYKDGLIRFNIPSARIKEMGSLILPPDATMTLDPAAFIIKGVHNIENAMAAALMAYLAGCSFSGIKEALMKFPGLEHRLEIVRELDGVRYINDSKGTNVGAVLKSLEGFSEPVVLIAGGKDKDSDFTLLRPLLEEKARKVILVGDAAEKIGKAIKGAVEYEMAGFDFKKAIDMARASARQGDVVLLSPACASFDMFDNFEHRGREFKRMVMEL